MKSKCFSFFLIFCFLCSFQPAFSANLENGVYDLVIAIDSTLPYAGNEGLIDDIEDMMRDASSYMHNALYDQGRFGNVTIIVPDSWPDNITDEVSTGATFSAADIFIGDNVLCGACAGPGRISFDIERMSGDTMVHEWGHYRFNLGDEYCDYVYKNNDWYQVYNTTAGWNRCTALQKIERECDERVQGDSSLSCNTLTNEVNGARASIMHREWNTGIEHFCDDSSDDELMHNSTVNNHQNRIWDNRSCWSVISSHGDGFKFTGGTTVSYVDPDFTVTKSTNADIVLVVDVSGSMGNHDRIENASRAAKNFVDRSEEGSYIGIVAFDDTATTELDLTEISDNASRSTIKNNIPTTDTDGSTSIGGGLLQAKEILDDSTNAHAKVIVILSDGEENTDPRIADVMDDITDADIIVYSLGLGAASDSKLQDIAAATDGTYYYAADNDVQALNEAYTDIANTIGETGSTVLSEILTVSADATRSQDVLLDATLGKNTIFTFSADPENIADISAELISPDGDILGLSYSGYAKDEVMGIILFRIDGTAQAGNWTATLSNNGSSITQISTEVTSRKAPDKNILFLKSSLSTYSPVFPEPVIITAPLMSQDALIHATVWAEITQPSGRIISLPLIDNGQGGDIFPLDGVYSGLFTDYSQNGRYSVKVYANNNNNETQVGALFNDKKHNENSASQRLMDSVSVSLGFNFSRVVSAGAFELTNYSSGDQIQPAAVKSLNVIDDVQVPPSLILGWLATGDDMSNGIATTYDLRYSTNPIDSDGSFNSATALSGLATPKTAGQEEQITVDELRCNTKYYFALKVTDEAGNISSLSNTPNGLIDDVTAPVPDLSVLPELRDECKVVITTIPTATDNCAGILQATTNDPLEYPDQGRYTVTWRYTDMQGNSTVQKQTVVVEDITPPAIESIEPSKTSLWPPNHAMHEINLTVVATDNCDSTPKSKIIGITSNEPDDGPGDGSTSPDWEITGDLTFRLRAERSGKKTDRIYTITVECTDYAGNSSTQTTEVHVAHDKGKK